MRTWCVLRNLPPLAVVQYSKQIPRPSNKDGGGIQSGSRIDPGGKSAGKRGRRERKKNKECSRTLEVKPGAVRELWEVIKWSLW